MFTAFKGMVVLIFVFMATFTWAQAPQSNQDIFPDTPENRNFFANTQKRMATLERERGGVAKVNNIDMHYLEWGDKNGVPLIWSHGYGSSRFEMAQVGESLAEAGYHVIAVSYRGHEKTQVLDYSFSLADIADDIAALLDQRGYSQAIIGGLSFGGGVTTTFYENYPERVMGLVLEDGGSVPVLDMEEKDYRSLMEETGSNEIPPDLYSIDFKFSDPFLMFQLLYQTFCAKIGGTLPPGAEIAIAGMIAQKKDGTWGLSFNGDKLMGGTYIPGQSGKLTILNQSWLRILPEVTYRKLSVPMLIIDPTGDDKQFGSRVPMNSRLTRLHPNLVKHVKYPDTPHEAHPVRPKWFVRDMVDLLHRVKAQKISASPEEK